MTIDVATLGFPRIGPRRELKAALEAFWAERTGADVLLAAAIGLRAATWARQRGLGATRLPSGDFSLYDHVLDTSVMVGAIPERFGWRGGPVPLDTYFAMARGAGDGIGGVAALELTKWFDTNYHYLVPEFRRGQTFELASAKPIDEFVEARGLGFHTRPVLLGPVTYLRLGKSADPDQAPLALLPELLPVYAEVLRRLDAAGADWVQLDEPCLVLDLDPDERAALAAAYDTLSRAAPRLKLLLATYFGGLGDNLDTALRLPVAGLHLDLVRAPEQLDAVGLRAPADLVLSLGVVDGRNVWRSDLANILDRLEPIIDRRGADRVVLAPSCSLIHVPIDLALDDKLDPEIRTWLAFAVQKVGELAIVARALTAGRAAVAEEIAAASVALAARRSSNRIHDAHVQARLAAITPDMLRRRSSFAERRPAQRRRLPLPTFPTTTIGSFPQTDEVRRARAAHARGALSEADYTLFLQRETEAAVRWQESIGLDVLVHGEFERNDMVQYFGEQLAGFAFTERGWVQSYGSRCVRPPIIFGDVSRPRPMTLEWARYAQSLTDRPIKGMLTGPLTMAQWSFVRDDLARQEVCRQIALALRDEVADLERAGIRIIQIDEPAFREGLPLRRVGWSEYLDWAAGAFRLASSVVRDETQIHSHMCYSEFNDIIAAIADLDADVVSIESSRSQMELLAAFANRGYPNEIGPGVYDIHSPRVPDVEEIARLLGSAVERLGADRLWVNPDCGLKTRAWQEVRPALINMVAAAIERR